MNLHNFAMATDQIRDLVSIVIPVFNEEAGISQLQQRLASLRAAWDKSVDLEFIFVDDGSSDRTRFEFLRETFQTEPGVMILAHEHNRGIGAALRTGFSRCRGNIVCTIDARTELRARKLAASSRSPEGGTCRHHGRVSVSPERHGRRRAALAASAQQVLLSTVRPDRSSSPVHLYQRFSSIPSPGHRFRFIPRGRICFCVRDSDTRCRSGLPDRGSSHDLAFTEDWSDQDEDPANDSWAPSPDCYNDGTKNSDGLPSACSTSHIHEQVGPSFLPRLVIFKSELKGDTAMVRVGVAGLGAWGWNVARSFADLRDCELISAAISIPRGRPRPRKHGHGSMLRGALTRCSGRIPLKG